MTTVLIVDGDVGFRRALQRLLEPAGLTVVAEAGDVATAERLLQEHRPDLAIVDLVLPDVNGLEGITRLKAQLPGLRVVLVSIHHDAELHRAALERGAEAFLPKEQIDMVAVRAWRGITFLQKEP